MYDTIRHKRQKPKPYDLLPLSAGVIVANVLLAKEKQAHQTAIICMLGAYYLAVILCLLLAFHGQLQYNPYSSCR